MKQIIKFIEKYRYFILFIFLEFFALFFTIQSHSYHRSRFVNSANSITGNIYNKLSEFRDFFNLKTENQRLLDENTYLKNLLNIENLPIDSINSFKIDTTNQIQPFTYFNAKIIKNDYSKRNNYLLINKGNKQGIEPEMAVVNSKGIIGVTKSVSKYNSTVISVLNKYSQINAKIKNNNHFGTLNWDGKDYRKLQLLDLPRQANIKIGDTIITGGKSTIFPEGILVGTIENIEKSNKTFKLIDVLLFNDMSSISNVKLIKNNQKKEILFLESTNNE